MRIIPFSFLFAIVALAVAMLIPMSAMAEMKSLSGAVAVERVADAKSPTGRWLAEDIRGGGVIDRLQTVLEIAEDGTITGTGGCNRMTGKAAIDGDSITFGPIAATKMACTPAVMDQEGKFFAALQDVKTWQVDPVRRKLTLFDEGGNAVIVLALQ